MGIHHTYKSQAGERAFKKQGKQLERQRRSRNRKILKQQQQKENNNNFVVPVNTPINMLTDPHRNGKI